MLLVFIDNSFCPVISFINVTPLKFFPFDYQCFVKYFHYLGKNICLNEIVYLGLHYQLHGVVDLKQIDMTAQQLNRDIKRLNNAINAHPKECPTDTDAFQQFIDNYARKEFIGLHNAADNFRNLNKQSILILLRLNLRYRFIAFHSFGLSIEI